MIKEILKKLIKCTKHYKKPNKMVHSMHGIILLRTSDTLFGFHRIMTKEVMEYCEKEGFDIDEIHFFSSYSVNKGEVTKSIKSNNKSKINIMKVGDKTFAHVLMDTTIIKNE
tara:strand:- start:1862 stop:2197 length:336 start_codon:yes stop_codon:yes gene_type:complete